MDERGFDLDLFSVADLVNVPLIAGGGCGKVDHIAQIQTVCWPEGVAIGSALHYNNMEISMLSCERNYASI